MSVPITVIIGLLGILFGAWFQRRHWLRSVAEEVRVRETKDASELIELIATTFDRRIAAQRAFLHSIGDVNREAEISKYREAINEYGEKINTIRSKLFFYFSYSEVYDYEEELHNRLIINGANITRLYKEVVREESEDLNSRKEELDKDLSLLSAKVFRSCRNLYGKVALLEFGTLRKIHDWQNPNNEYVSSMKLARKVLNI
ncbi:hypothetical protein [uncultured Roseibium sp.]|uniref:hypothetical protein n=1 Tax=uncultured Roseibium sp. TaxID=1936171 RepID=UPI0026062F38|nr:hypothetical protein [uncultured Roseibium sp.]